MSNIKALAPTVQKLLARLKFQRGGQNDSMTELQNGQNDRQDKNNMPPDLRFRGHKKKLHRTLSQCIQRNIYDCANSKQCFTEMYIYNISSTNAI